MTIIQSRSLSTCEMKHLGNNILPAVRAERIPHADDQRITGPIPPSAFDLPAVNRSLAIHGEAVAH